MEGLFGRIAAEESIAGAIEHARREAVALGALATTFHIAAPHASQVGPNVYIAVHGHTGSWLEDYYTPEIRADDPFPDYIMKTGHAMTYAEALAQMKLSAAQSAFVEKYHAGHLESTLAVPAYGPYDVDTYATFTLTQPFAAADEELKQTIVLIVELTNRRVAQLLETEKGTDITLSTREQEVLKWMGRSKSNGDIATILDVSAGTIDTYVRRIYAKLDVNDRIAATVKGIRLGLIRF